MKKILGLLLILCLTVDIPAMAEAVGNAPLTPAAGEALAIDLDGDGSEETLSWEMAPAEYEEALTLTVIGASGAAQVYATDIIWAEAVYVVDLDGDGAQELLLTGDVMSDDYSTWCLRWDGAALYEVLFPDADRGENTDGYFKQGYGRVEAIGDNLLSLAGSQDALGTWFATRILTLTPYDRFEFNDAGLWMRNLDGYEAQDKAELWEYAALTVTRPLPYGDVHRPDQSAGTLEPGEKILVYATDKREYAYFTTQDGASGALAISPNEEQGWGWLVGGVPEEECFESLPYAD